MSPTTSKSVTLRKKNYLRLTQLGYADETADNVVGRILDIVEEIGKENK